MGKIAFLDKIGVTLNARTKLDASDINEIKAAVNSLYDIFDTVGSEPVGSTRNWWCLATIPTDYELITEAQKWLSKVDYASLYIALGGEANVFGVTATEFSIPYYPEGTSIVQVGYNFPLAKPGGDKLHKLTIQELPPHSFKTVIAGNNNEPTLRSDPNASIVDIRDDRSDGNSDYALDGKVGIPTLGKTNTVGSGVAHNNMPPYIGAYFIIKVRSTTIVPFDNPTYILSTTTASSNVQIPIPAGTFIKDIDVFVVSGTPTINIPSISSGDMSGQDLYPSTANLRFVSDGLLDVNVSGGTVKIQVIKYNI